MSVVFCNLNNWYRDSNLTVRNNATPRNTIDDASIIPTNYILNLSIESCFTQIPFLEFTNLKLTTSIDVIDTATPTFVSFQCAELNGDILIIDRNIQCNHWESSSFCEWSIDTLSINSGIIQNIVLNIGSSGLIENSDVQDCYISAGTIGFKNNNFTQRNMDFQTSMIVDSGVIDNCNITNSGIMLDGNFTIKNNTISYASGDGEFIINNSKNHGNLSGPCIFDSGSINEGSVNGRATLFTNDSRNNNWSIGPTTFINSSNYGLVSGEARFIGSSINFGKVYGPAIFMQGAINSGVVTDESLFIASINSGTLDGNTKLFNSQNFGKINSAASFYNSINSGIIFCKHGRIYFSGSTNRNNIYSIDSCNVIFENDSDNFGLVNGSNISVSFEKNSHNRGELINTQSCIFKSGCTNENMVFQTLLSSFDNTKNNGFVKYANNVLFLNSGLNLGSIYSSKLVEFKDNSTNCGDVDNSIVKFFNNSINSGNVLLSPSFFYNNSTNNGSVGSGDFYDKSKNSKLFNTGLFYNQSINIGTGVRGFFYQKSYANIQSSGQYLYFNDNSINFGATNFISMFDNSVNSGNVSSSGMFFNYSTNYGTIIGPSTFFDNSKNLGSIGTSIFNNNSQNLGTGLSCLFFDQSINNKRVFNNGIFSGNSINRGSVQTANFLDRSINYGIIENMSTFSGLSENRSFIDAEVLFLGASKNIGEIININKNIIFDDGALNLGKITNQSLLVFYKFSRNKGEINTLGITRFDDSGIWSIYTTENSDTSGIIKNEGNIYGLGSVEFIGGDPTNNFLFKMKNIGNIDVDQNVLFNNSINLSNIKSNTIFINNSYNLGSLYQSNFTNSINSGNTQFSLFNNSLNFGKVLFAEFSNNSFNYGAISEGASFSSSKNYEKIGGNGFFQNSENSGIIQNSGVFNNNSANYGTVKGNALFLTGSCNYGIVEGEIQSDNTCSGVAG